MPHGLEGPAKRINAFVGEDAMYDDKPLYQALIDQARTQGCAGATALRGMVGYGASSRGVVKHGLRMSMDCPVLVTVVDEPQHITALAAVWSAMISSGLVTVEDIKVVHYSADGDGTE